MSPRVRLDGQLVRVGERFALSFQRTLRVPDDGRDYPLPPGLGMLPIHPVRDFESRVPSLWEESAFFLAMYQREAMWIAFHAAYWKPNALKVGIGGVNAVSGEVWDLELHAEPQDYLVAPDQPWLDGINSGRGTVSQFVAAPLGSGYTVEAQLTGKEGRGGIQIVVYEPKPGIFPDKPPPTAVESSYEESAPLAMGIAAGGKINQKIYPDPHGIGTWDRANRASVQIYIVNSAEYMRITGHPPPPTPASAELYTYARLPWFDLYDEEEGDIASPERLSAIATVGELDALAGSTAGVDEPLDVSPEQIQELRRTVSKTERTSRNKWHGSREKRDG